LFYLYGATSASLVNITDLYGTWVPLTPLNWSFAQNCGNSTLMISTTFQLGSNASYVEKFLVGSGNCTDEDDFIKSVVLAIDTLGDLNIDYHYKKENETVPVPVHVPSPKPVKIPSPNPSPNPSSVKVPQPDQIPSPRNMPEPGTKQPEEVPLPVPEPATKQVPKAAPVPEPVIVNVPAPKTKEPSPSPQLMPTAQDPAPGMKRSTEQAPSPDPLNSTENGTSPSLLPVPEPATNQVPKASPVPEPVIVNVPAPITKEPSPSPESLPTVQNPEPITKEPSPSPSLALKNVTEPVPSPSHPTLNATTNFTSRWVHVFFTPKTFNVTILSNQTDIYYIKDGPCMPIIDYWKNVTLGCPCNGTWNNTGYYNSSTKSFEGGRQITPSQCPDNTCQEAFFLNDTITYANLRLNITTFVVNGTVANKTVEITKISLDKDVGYAYGAKDIIAVFVLSTNENNASFPIVPVITKSEMNETLRDSGSMSLSLTTIVTMMFSFLLIMYENTQ